MKRMIALLLCCLLLTACSLNATGGTTGTEADITAPSATEVPTEALTEAPTEALTEAPTESPTEAPTEAPLQSLTLYYGDDNAEFILSKEVQVAEITADTIIEQLISAGVLREGVAVNSMFQNGSSLFVDFNQEFANLVCSMGTAGEYIIIGSTVNTFLGAFQATSVTFTVNGQVLESGHAIYDFPLTFMS